MYSKTNLGTQLCLETWTFLTQAENIPVVLSSNLIIIWVKFADGTEKQTDRQIDIAILYKERWKGGGIKRITLRKI